MNPSVRSHSDKFDLSDLRLIAELAARRGGQIAVTAGIEDRLATDTKTSRTDWVTVVDRRAEEQIVDFIRSRRPEDGFVTEEGTVLEKPARVQWVIDPIDGTVNFVYGISHFCTSVAVEIDSAAVVGAVYDPVADELFSGQIGAGAWLNGMPLVCPDRCEALEEAVIGTGFSYTSLGRAEQGVVVGELLPRVGDLRRLGSAALDICWVGAGRLDGFYEKFLNRWDFAGADVVARASGAQSFVGNAGYVVAGRSLAQSLNGCLLSLAASD